MHIVLVHVHVLPEKVEAFRLATIENARKSILEEGILRFDFIQSVDDPTRFVLIEVYRQPEAQLKHRETAHYNTWKDMVADMMAEPRQGIKYVNIYPSEADWLK